MATDFQKFRLAARARLLQGVKDAPSEWRGIVDVEKSDSHEGQYDTYNAAGRVVEDLGGGFDPETGVSFEYTLTNKTYTVSSGVSRDRLDDDRLGAFTNLFRTLGKRLANFPFERAMTVLTTGDANNGPDGTPFFGNSHDDYTSLDNALTSLAAAGDAVPTLGEMETQFAIMMASFLEFTDRSGANIHYDQGALWLVVGPQLQTVARRMLNAQLGTNGQTQIHLNDAKLMVLPANHMQDTSVVKEMFLLKTDEGSRPLILQERSPIVDKSWEDEGGRNIFFGAEMRFEVGFNEPASAIHQVYTT